MTANAKVALLFAALALALFAAGSWRAEARAQRVAQQRLAEISPPAFLCTALKGRQWRKWMHAQQADGGRWTHACSYDVGVYL